MKCIDLTGQIFSKWTVIDLAPKRGHVYYWNCRCDCGRTFEVRGTSLRNGQSTKCIYCKTLNKTNAKTHGYGGTKVYKAWHNMIRRCYNPNCIDFENWGGRGIKVCDRWLNSFENFYADMGDPPKDKSLDRIDNDGHYKPSNCKWSTKKEQQNNTRKSLHRR